MATTKWVLDPTHSEVEFKVKHLMISTVTGTFSSFAADVTTEDEDFTTAKATFTVDVASINTKNEQRDGHIRTADFFDVASYPQMKFVLKEIEDVDNDGSFNIHGDLTLRGITKSIRLEVEFGGVIKDPWGNTRAGLHRQRQDQPQGIWPHLAYDNRCRRRSPRRRRQDPCSPRIRQRLIPSSIRLSQTYITGLRPVMRIFAPCTMFLSRI